MRNTTFLLLLCLLNFSKCDNVGLTKEQTAGTLIGVVIGSLVAFITLWFAIRKCGAMRYDPYDIDDTIVR